MKNNKGIVLILLIFFDHKLHSQEWAEAKCFSYLKDEKVISLKFKYDHLMVDDGNVKNLWDFKLESELKPEAEFLRLKVEKYNRKNKGYGEAWVKDWEQNKKNDFEASFEKLFNKGTKHKLLVNRLVDTLKYTMLINVKEMAMSDGGYTVCDFEVLIFETAKPYIILSLAQMYRVEGLKYRRWNTGPFSVLAFFLPFLDSGAFNSFSNHVKDCYAGCGKDLGHEILLCCQHH